MKPLIEKRAARTSVGAIRWDAWYAHDGRADSVISQVERSLSPAKYHFRAPFYAEITAEGGIEIPDYTQADFDREMEYAIAAGLDYFAYVWYDSGLRAARDFHTTSKYKKCVKLCAVLDGNAIGKAYAREELAVLLKEDFYMTVLDGRPLMYYFGTGNNYDAIGADIEYYTALCRELGLPRPFSVLMGGWPEESRKAGADALSRYAVSGSGGASFRSLTETTEKVWETQKNSGLQSVPPVTAGWHNGTRWENPVSWCKPGADSWVEYAAPEEIEAHLRSALRYLKKEENKASTLANTLILYAWNEHDEGGWICPPLAVDENGNQLYNEDGSKKLNESRIQAVERAIRAER